MMSEVELNEWGYEKGREERRRRRILIPFYPYQLFPKLDEFVIGVESDDDDITRSPLLPSSQSFCILFLPSDLLEGKARSPRIAFESETREWRVLVLDEEKLLTFRDDTTGLIETTRLCSETRNQRAKKNRSQSWAEICSKRSKRREDLQSSSSNVS